jgi:hypothetical protein
MNIRIYADIADCAEAARFVGAKVAQLRSASKNLGPGVRVRGKKVGRSATFLGKHPDPDYWGDFWWQLAEEAPA